MSSNEYSGLPFAVGTVTGGRSWTVDTMGRLVGNYGQIWRPGENVAVCPKNCAGVEEKCTCGFYAYHAPGDSYEDAFGVIEGYGIVVVGTQGFRCSKARIIGLHVDKDKRALVARNYPDIPLLDKRKQVKGLLRREGIPTPEALGDEFWTLGAKPLTAPDAGMFITVPQGMWITADATWTGSPASSTFTFTSAPPKPSSLAPAIEPEPDLNEGSDE